MRINHVSASAGVHLSTVLFGLSAVLAKDLILPVMAIVAGRALWAVLTLALVVAGKRQVFWHTITMKDFIRLLVNGMLLAGHWLCFFIGVQQGGVAVGTLGFACFPVFVSLIGWGLFHTRITVRDVCCMGLIALGLSVISLEMLQSASGLSALLWALASGLSYAVIVLYNRHVDTAASPLQASLLQCVGCALVTVPFGYGALMTMTMQENITIMVIGVVCTGVAYTLLTFALKKIAAQQAAIIISLEPVWAILFAAILFHALPDIQTGAGGMLIIVAVMLGAKQSGVSNTE